LTFLAKFGIPLLEPGIQGRTMRTSFMGKSLVFSGIVLFGGIVVAEMVSVSLSNTPLIKEEANEPTPPSTETTQPASGSASQPRQTNATAVKVERILDGVERIKQTFKLLHRSKETTSSANKSKQGS
jgi:hypothetical protein